MSDPDFNPLSPPSGVGLDPADWSAFRAEAHRMLDDILDYQQGLRRRPVWQAPPPAVRARYAEPLPQQGQPLAEVHVRFMNEILPYAVGNAHPAFMGWVHGGGAPVGMLAEMLAAGLNANLGGRDQMPIEVERQVTRWMRELFDFPESASGVFVTGTSQANLLAVLTARTAALGATVRQQGLGDEATRLVAYASAGAHACIARALEAAGLGRQALRAIPLDADFRLNVAALEAAIAADRAAGRRPFLLVGTAGSVDVGAIDPLASLGGIARQNRLWFHVDGAFGALGRLAPGIAPLLDGIETADSIAFDFHKWLQAPYDAGFFLARDGAAHRAAFDSPADYLARVSAGLAAGSPWPCDFGLDLSRGFRALKVWFLIQTHGARRLGEMIAATCALAGELAERVAATPPLELLAPVPLNIVCFRYRFAVGSEAEQDRLNAALAIAVQTSGRAAPSTTRIHGRLALRAAIVNHRTTRDDIGALLAAVLEHGAQLAAATKTSTGDWQ